MKTFLLDNDTKPKELIEWVNNLSEEGQVFLDSNGGLVADFYIYRKVMENKDITLRAVSMCSSAFTLFYLYDGKKTIEDECFAVIHAIASQYYVFNENGIKIRATSVQKQSINSESKQIRYGILTKTEMKQYLNGEDVYLCTQRLQSYFENSKK